MVIGTLANASTASSLSDPLPFFTSAGSASWIASKPIWAAKCGSSGDKNPHFALFHANVNIAIPSGSNGILSSLFYATAAPPIYNDPWNVTNYFSLAESQVAFGNIDGAKESIKMILSFTNKDVDKKRAAEFLSSLG